MAEDCGPCTQLAVTMAEQEGVAPEILRAIIAGDVHAMPDRAAAAIYSVRNPEKLTHLARSSQSACPVLPLH
jgi:hypothetical protein